MAIPILITAINQNTTPFDFFMLGELFQNNHHKRPNSANFAARWFEFDPVYPVMKLMHWIRLIKLREAYFVGRGKVKGKRLFRIMNNATLPCFIADELKLTCRFKELS